MQGEGAPAAALTRIIGLRFEPFEAVEAWPSCQGLGARHKSAQRVRRRSSPTRPQNGLDGLEGDRARIGVRAGDDEFSDAPDVLLSHAELPKRARCI